MEMEKVDNTVTEFVRMYLRDIGPLSVYNFSEELELFELYNRGDITSLQKLVLGSQYIVIEEVLYFINLGIELVDLIQFANVALIESLKNFALSSQKKGLKSFLHRNIYRRLQNYIANYFSLIRYPANRLEPLVNYNTEEISRQLNYYSLPIVFSPENKYSDAKGDYDEIEYCKMLYLRLDDIENIYEYLPSEENAEKNLLAEILQEGIDYYINTLKENESTVVRQYFGLHKDKNSSRPIKSSLKEIGDKLQLTRERVRQIKEKAISRLKHKSRRAELLFLWECCEKMGGRNWYFPISNSRDLFFIDPFNEIVEDEKCALKLLKEYVKPRRRKEFVKGVKNLSEHYRKLITSFLNEIGNVTLNTKVIKHIKSVDDGMFNSTIYDYAISTSENIKKVNEYIGLIKHFEEF
tara:strand:+ start:47 stop:1273 length:1227 start_codon:yes stop_codon:yes gene_type:complete